MCKAAFKKLQLDAFYYTIIIYKAGEFVFFVRWFERANVISGNINPFGKIIFALDSPLIHYSFRLYITS